MTKQQSDQALGSLAWLNLTCLTRGLFRGVLENAGEKRRTERKLCNPQSTRRNLFNTELMQQNIVDRSASDDVIENTVLIHREAARPARKSSDSDDIL